MMDDQKKVNKVIQKYTTEEYMKTIIHTFPQL